MLDFTGKNAIVTGATRGIGLEVARSLAAQGCNIAVLDINLGDNSSIEGIVKDFGVKAKGWVCDVSNTEAVTTVFKEIIAEFGTVEVLVNNAGITRDSLLMRMKDEDFDSVIAVNLRSVFVTTKAIVRQMMKQKYGRIVNTASINGLVCQAGQANYAASKSGVIGITKSNAKEFAAKGITINAVAPGFIRTDMTDKLSDEQIAAFSEAIPSKALGTPKDVANAVCFLASEEAGYINGHILSVDAGMNA
ncbi:MAG: 3-oxoacyl-[acyl-carrier-protein] reductase [Fibrobacterales bacterium]